MEIGRIIVEGIKIEDVKCTPEEFNELCKTLLEGQRLEVEKAKIYAPKPPTETSTSSEQGEIKLPTLPGAADDKGN
jgi:hypothetical protein